MNSIRLGLAGVLVGTMLTALPAVGQDATIRFATWDSDTNLGIQQEIARLFEARHPGVTVQVEPYADGFDQKLVAAFGAGDPPDVMYMWNFPQYFTSLMPLDELLARDAAEIDLEDIPAALFNNTMVNGATYGVPSGFTTYVIYYNKDLFAAAGVEQPQPGWTWDDLREKAAQLRDAENRVYGFAVNATPDPYDYELLFWSNGTSYISPDGTAIEGYMNSPESAEVLEMLAAMARNEEAVTVGVGDMSGESALFRSGNIAMQLSAMWSKGGHDAAGVNYGVAELPRFGDKPAHSGLALSAVSIAKDTRSPDIAWEFVKFFASPEAVAMRTGDLPIRTSVAEELNLLDDPIYKPFFDILAVSDREVHAFLKHRNWSRIQENLERAIEATLLDQGDAKAHLDEAVARSARLLN